MFDYEDEGYFTREDLNSLCAEIEDLLPEGTFIAESYIDKKNVLELVWHDKNEIEYSLFQKIDLQRAWSESTICEKYAPMLAEQMITKMKEMEQEPEVEW